MYISFRSFRANPGALQELIGVATWVCQTMNGNHGTDLRTSVQIGGDPDVVSVTGRWETLGAYEEARTAIAADPEIAGATRMATALGTSEGDGLGQVLRPPGEPGGFAVVNSAAIQLTRVQEAAAFVLEAAEVGSQVSGTEVGVVRAVTGPANGVMWVTFQDSMQAIQDAQAKLDGSEDFVSLYKRSEDVMVPNSLELSIRQFVG